MNDKHLRFVEHLEQLATHNRAALASLRRSLAFAPGTYAAAMPYVEPFTAQGDIGQAQREALYVTAGLFAANPRHRDGQPFPAALAEVRLRRKDARIDKSESIEKRFIALLGADADALPVHLRHANSLLAAAELGFDVAQLASDLEAWLDPWRDTQRDHARQRWARAFYGRLAQAADKPEDQSKPEDTDRNLEAEP
jgi:CRISPR system Cascade subunit CasB